MVEHHSGSNLSIIFRGNDSVAETILSDVFVYDPSSPSCLRWKFSRGRNAKAGEAAGTMHKSGYYRVNSLGKFTFAHRIVWMMHFGDIPADMQIDHVDGNRTNNVVSNLRLASHGENKRNESIRADNSTGVKGLVWFKPRNSWRGQITFNGKTFIKTSKDREVVERWLMEKRVELHGEFARHR